MLKPCIKKQFRFAKSRLGPRIRKWQQVTDVWQFATSSKASTRIPNNYSKKQSHCTRAHTGLMIRNSRLRTMIWPVFTESKETSLQPSRCSNVRLAYTKKP